MNKWIVGIGIFVLVVLGFLFVSTMTGNVVTGSTSEKQIDNEYFIIDEVKVNDSIELGKLNEEADALRDGRQWECCAPFERVVFDG